MLIQQEKTDLFSLLRPVKQPKIWAYLAWVDTVNQYRRTLLGPLWILLSLIIFVLAVGSVYSGLFSVEYFDYITFMAAGMIAWNWSSAILVGSGTIYSSNAGLILDYPVNKPYLIWSHTMGQMIIFLHQLPLFFIVYLLGGIQVNVNMLYIIPSICIIFAINIGAAASLSILVVRYRDLNKILTSLIVVIMIVTPIFWKPEMVTGMRALVYYLNPFYYIVEIIRNPLLGLEPKLFHYVVSLIIALTSLLVGAFAHKRYSKYVVFWV